MYRAIADPCFFFKAWCGVLAKVSLFVGGRNDGGVGGIEKGS